LLLGSTSIVSELHQMFTSEPAAFSWNESTTGDSCIVYRMPREDFYSSPTTLTKYTTYTQLQLAFNRSQGRLCINFFGARWAAWDTAWKIIEKHKVVDEEALTVWATSTEHGLEECIYTPFNVAHYASHSQREGGYTDEDLRLYEDLLARETEEARKVVDTMGPGETRKVEEVKKAMEDRKNEEARKAKDAEKAEAKRIEEAKRAEEAAAREQAERKAREDAAADKAEREAWEFGAEFVIELDMTEGHSIGAELYSPTDHDPVVISKWNTGSPVEAWNRAHPDKAVQVGDEISKVSDIAWDHRNHEFLHSLKHQVDMVSGTTKALELVIKRTRHPEVSVESAKPEASSDTQLPKPDEGVFEVRVLSTAVTSMVQQNFNMEAQDTDPMTVTGIPDDSPFAKYNELHPATPVKVGDTVVAVGGSMGGSLEWSGSAVQFLNFFNAVEATMLAGKDVSTGVHSVTLRMRRPA